MKYRFWNLDKDYTILEGWCKERNWESNIPKEMLPPQGIIVEDEDTICALGLYLNEQNQLINNKKDFFNNWKSYGNTIDEHNVNTLNAS